MTAWVQPILDYLSQNPTTSWAIIFLVSMGEALFVVGLVVPSTAVLVGAGTLVGLGKLQFWPVFAMTISGAVAGDAISYWFGHIYKDRVMAMWPFSRYPDAIEKGVVFMRRHGGKSVFIGRFVPGVKAVVPGLAGIMGMNAWQFTWINVVSAVAWAAVHLLPSILAGAALSILGAVSGRLMSVAAFTIFGLLFLGWIIKWGLLWIGPRLGNVRQKVAEAAKSHDHAVPRWIGRTFDPSHPRPATMSVAALVLAVGLPLFFLIASELGAGEPMVLADSAIGNFVSSLRTQAVDRLMIAVTSLGDGLVLVPVVLCVVVWLAYRRAFVPMIGILSATVSAAIFVPAIKFLVHRTRPLDIYEGVSSLSFPSGHSTTNAVFYGILAYLVAHILPRWGQAIIYAFGAVLVVLIGLSRIYLGVHWPSDVAAGLLFGLALAALYVVVLGGRDEREGGLKLGTVVLGALMAFGSLHLATGYGRALAFYERPRPVVEARQPHWLNTFWQQQRALRIDLGGETEEPLTIQATGTREAIAARLGAAGWQVHAPFVLRDIAGYLSPAAKIIDLPVLPVLNDGYAPALTFTRPASTDESKRRLTLRLWQAPVIISDGGARDPLFLGSIVEEEASSPLGALSVTRAIDGYVPSAAELLASFPTATLVQRTLSAEAPAQHVPVVLVPTARKTLTKP